MNPKKFRKIGLGVMLATLLFAVVTSRLGLTGYVRLALLTFGFGAGFMLAVVAGFLPPGE